MHHPGYTPFPDLPKGKQGEYNISLDDENDNFGGDDFNHPLQVSGCKPLVLLHLPSSDDKSYYPRPETLKKCLDLCDPTPLSDPIEDDQNNIYILHEWTKPSRELRTQPSHTGSFHQGACQGGYEMIFTISSGTVTSVGYNSSSHSIQITIYQKKGQMLSTKHKPRKFWRI